MMRGIDEWSQPKMGKDGRHIDTTIATLEGEAAGQQTAPAAPAETPWHIVPGHALSPYLEPTYYDKPAIKPPVWIWSIPTYFYVGGVAGAAMTLGMAAQFLGGRQLRRFDELCRWIGAIGGGIGSALLIYDLGRRSRFLFMLRVFRPTSPMSIGSWVLAAATPLSAGSALLTVTTKGWRARLDTLLGLGAGILGLPLASYTSVLIANTAVPLWQGTRLSLPFLFTSSSVAGVGCILELLPLSERECRIARRFGTLGRIAELASGAALEREAARVPRVARPLHEGFTGALWTASKVLTASSLALSLLRKRRAAGVLGILGGLAVRFAIFYGGKRSALDPRATFRQQLPSRDREGAVLETRS